MILLHTVPYVRQEDRFTTADQYGAWVAHQDLIKAMLQHSSIEGIHFYLPFKKYSKEELPVFDELRRDFPHHEIEIKQMVDLHDSAKRYRYVLADDFEAFTTLALARYTGKECLFPLATIVHTIPHNLALLGYSHVLLLAETFDVIVTTSKAGQRTIRSIFEDVKEFMAQRLKVNLVQEINITRIPLAVDAQFLRPRDSKAARLELNLALDSTIILYIGRLSEEFKADLEPLLNTFRRLSSENSDLLLVIAGQDMKGNYSEVVLALAEQFGIIDRVRVIANFPFSNKPLLYASADIFVSPVDNIQETFGLSILEAMASGLPVVASDWSGYRDLVVHGESGFLVRTIWNSEASHLAAVVAPLLNSRMNHFLAQQTVIDSEDLYRYLKLLSGNKELRSRFGNIGRERVVSEFCWPVVVKQYEELWRKQWLEMDRLGRKNESRLPLNYDRQFGHFATAFLQRDMKVRTSEQWHSPRDSNNLDQAALAHPARIQEMRRVVRQCSLRPQSIEELIASGNETTGNVIAWLWKKGYLELSET